MSDFHALILFTQNYLVIQNYKKVCSNYNVVNIFIFLMDGVLTHICNICRDLGFVVSFYFVWFDVQWWGNEAATTTALHFSKDLNIILKFYNNLTLSLTPSFVLLCVHKDYYVFFVCFFGEKGIRVISRKAHHLSTSIIIFIIVTGILFTFSSLERYYIVHVKDLFTFVKYKATYFWVS